MTTAVIGPPVAHIHNNNNNDNDDNVSYYYNSSITFAADRWSHLQHEMMMQPFTVVRLRTWMWGWALLRSGYFSLYKDEYSNPPLSCSCVFDSEASPSLRASADFLAFSCWFSASADVSPIRPWNSGAVDLSARSTKQLVSCQWGNSSHHCLFSFCKCSILMCSVSFRPEDVQTFSFSHILAPETYFIPD